MSAPSGTADVCGEQGAPFDSVRFEDGCREYVCCPPPHGGSNIEGGDRLAEAMSLIASSGIPRRRNEVGGTARHFPVVSTRSAGAARGSSEAGRAVRHRLGGNAADRACRPRAVIPSSCALSRTGDEDHGPSHAASTGHKSDCAVGTVQQQRRRRRHRPAAIFGSTAFGSTDRGRHRRPRSDQRIRMLPTTGMSLLSSRGSSVSSAANGVRSRSTSSSTPSAPRAIAAVTSGG